MTAPTIAGTPAPADTTRGAPGGGSIRAVRRRTPLPGSRAVVGGFLVATSVLGIFVAYSHATAGPTTHYVVARHDLTIGHRLTEADLALLPMELPEVMRANTAFTAESAVVGATVVGPIRRGELVQVGDVVEKRSAAGDLEVSFPLEASRAVGGRLRPGERVDVHATFGAGGDTYTVAVVRQATVVAASQSDDRLRAGNTQTITLAVGSADAALALSHAVSAGEVTLVRTTGTPADAPAPEIYRAPQAETRQRSG